MLLLDRLDEEYVTGGPTVRTLSDAGKSPERLSYLSFFSQCQHESVIHILQSFLSFRRFLRSPSF